MAYATLAELKGWVGIPALDTGDDTTLQSALDAAQAQIDKYCDRSFGIDGSVTTRKYTPDYPYPYPNMYYPARPGPVGATILIVDPIATTTGLVVATDDNDDGTAETSWTLNTNYRLEPVNASNLGEPWTTMVAIDRAWPRNYRYPAVSVTAKFGWPSASVPGQVKEATLIQAASLWKRKDAPFGVAGSVEFGSEVRLLAKLDPFVESLIRPLRRNWWAV